jgi:hypothetical protein
MTLNVKALTAAVALLTALCFLFVGLVNLAAPTYGVAMLDVAASIYPGYHGPSGFGSVIVVTLYGLVDGAVGGALLAWLYNLMGGGRPHEAGVSP